METPSEKKLKNLLDKFDDVTIDLIHSDSSIAESVLSESGYDLDILKEDAQKFFKQISFKQAAERNVNKSKFLLEKALVNLKESIQENSKHASEVLRTILAKKSTSPNFTLQYRKLEEWSDDEIRDVLSDIDLIHLFEELENKTDG